MKKIKFIDTSEDFSEIYGPQPSSKNLPGWYKNIAGYRDNDKNSYKDGTTSATIKKCIPVFDSLSAGYLIKTYCDIKIEWDDIMYTIQSPSMYNESVEYHPLWQAEGHPDVSSYHASVPKFMTRWAIKTPPGYSCLIIPPMHRENVIQILPGLIDTDSYGELINFPFVISKHGFSGVIPAGTPIAQIIPIKRESWEMSSYKDSKSHIPYRSLVRSVFFDGYKNLFWSRKSYK